MQVEHVFTHYISVWCQLIPFHFLCHFSLTNKIIWEERFLMWKFNREIVSVISWKVHGDVVLTVLLFLGLLGAVIAEPLVVLSCRLLIWLSRAGHGFGLWTMSKSNIFEIFDVDWFSEHGEISLSGFVKVSHGLLCQIYL